MSHHEKGMKDMAGKAAPAKSAAKPAPMKDMKAGAKGGKTGAKK